MRFSYLFTAIATLTSITSAIPVADDESNLKELRDLEKRGCKYKDCHECFAKYPACIWAGNGSMDPFSSVNWYEIHFSETSISNYIFLPPKFSLATCSKCSGNC
ncbi:hypothetical protein AJ79_10104 [Helicocarpus griseus UAMH5409]|uniref:Uncharacterized protein n=1 Tax=Helicocarpus griseus UAMH5409 TaxID=1447875 RepID=A0A2B7WFI0_9EURO|nr:hypothetical protein AJ79_10104 [Helicocarpus griseus UAMH5409]